MPTVSSTWNGKPPSGTEPITKPFSDSTYLIQAGSGLPLGSVAFTLAPVCVAVCTASSGKEMTTPSPTLEVPLGSNTATMPRAC